MNGEMERSEGLERMQKMVGRRDVFGSGDGKVER